MQTPINITPRQALPKRPMIALVIAVLILILVVVIATSCFVTVPTGHSGIMLTWGKVSDGVLSEGLHIKMPWQSIVLMDNRAQKEQLETQAFSSDIQQVDVKCSINFSVDRATAPDLYKRVGVSYYQTVMLPRLLENLKATFSKYTAENLVAARETLSKQVLGQLAPEMKAYGVEVLSLAIENIDFTDAFTDAVEAKQVAEQTKLKTVIQQSEQLSIEQTTAERSVIAAKAAADVQKINADAKAYSITTQATAEAEANKQVAASITPELIKYVQGNRWDGKLPSFVSGSTDALPIINVQPNAEGQ